MDTILNRYESQSGGPKYQAVATAIREAIEGGDLEVGQKLPPVRDLSWGLKMTPGTVARAYSILTDEGVLTAAVGRGTFVANPRAADAVALLANFHGNRAQDAEFVSLNSPRLPDMGQVDLIRAGFEKLSRRPGNDWLNYPSRASFEPARRAVLRWLRDTPLGAVDHEDLVLCHGAQNGNSLVMQSVLRSARPVVVLEEMSYPGFRRAAELLRAEVVSVGMDSQGIVPEDLERVVRQTGAQLLCTSPEVHNPTGLFTPLSRRREIAQVAERTGLHILEDDCYRLGRAQAQCYRALLPDQGWYVSSLSKSLTPSLRIGYAVAPKRRRSDLRRSAEHGFFGLACPLANLTEELLSHDALYDLAEKVRQELNVYIRAAVNVLGGFELSWRDGVPFLWLVLPPGWRSGTFVQAAESEGVQIRAADDFALRDARTPHAVRLGINAQVSLRSFEAALIRLRVLLDSPPERIAV